MRLKEDKYFMGGANVTVVSHQDIKTIKSWIDNENKTRTSDGGRWRLVEGGSLAIMGRGGYGMTGCEDDIVIFLNPLSNNFKEIVTRARQRLVIISMNFDFKNWLHLFKTTGAFDHNNCPLIECTLDKDMTRLIKTLILASDGTLTEATTEEVEETLYNCDECDDYSLCGEGQCEQAEKPRETAIDSASSSSSSSDKAEMTTATHSL